MKKLFFSLDLRIIKIYCSGRNTGKMKGPDAQMTDLEQIIRNRYISPLQRPRRDLVGIEFEFPVVHLGNRPVDFDVMQDMTKAFITKFHFERLKKDDDGRIFDAQKTENGDALSFDCSFNTVEFSFGVESDMNVLYRRFEDYYTFIEEFLLARGHTLTGMGINPNYRYNQKIPIKNGRYRMLFHHLESYPKYPEKKCHAYPNFGMFSCASQVQLDVDESNVLLALNTFARLEPFNSLLFANSYFADENTRLYLSRDYFWYDSMQGYNPHNLGMYETELHSVDEIVDYIKTESMYCLERDGKYINFAPTPLTDYFRADAIRGEFWNGEKYEEIEFSPRPEDLAYHRSYKFEDLTFRGTIEFRSCCEQPASEAMTVAAYFAGLMGSLPELKGLLDQDTSLYDHGYNSAELREIVNASGVPEFADPKKVRDTLLTVLDLAHNGLHRRGYGEEHFLDPLYKRAETLESPAQKMEKAIESEESREQLIREFAKLHLDK